MATKYLVSYRRVVRIWVSVLAIHATAQRRQGHVYRQLVRSVRRGRMIVPQTGAQLGELAAEGPSHGLSRWRERVPGTHRRDGREQLFDPSEPTGSVAIKLEEVVALAFTKLGGMAEVDFVAGVKARCDTLLASSAGRWSEVITFLVIGRLCEQPIWT